MKMLAYPSKQLTSKKPLKNKSVLLALILLVGSTVSLPISANPLFPSNGSAEYMTIYSGTVLSTMKLTDESVVELRELVGLTQSEMESSHYLSLIHI